MGVLEALVENGARPMEIMLQQFKGSDSTWKKTQPIFTGLYPMFLLEA